MRLWSIHPRYLDSAGLVAAWREALLAQAVLSGTTRGYTAHPQLDRFRAHGNPKSAIADYLHAIADEAETRAYAFDRTKIAGTRARSAITVSRAQLRFELQHLQHKVQLRNPRWYERIKRLRNPHPHPSFDIIAGGIAQWEKSTVREKDEYR